VGKEIQIRPHLAAALSPKGDMLATAHDFWYVKIWNVANGEVTEIACYERPYAVAFGPYGKVLAAGFFNGDVIQWDVLTKEQIGPSLRHEAAVWTVAYSPDGNILATASRKKDAKNTSLRLWDISAGPPYYGLKLPLNQTVPGKAALAPFGTLGKILVEKSEENRVLGWRLPSVPDDLREIQLRTWITLVLRRTNDGGLTAVSWEQHRKLRQELSRLQDKAE
jgi:WD40 repeat protein